jgi:magnesium-protoporphyrin O-methyltransferase
MHDAAYIKRRDEIRTYFDRTALDAWKRLTSTEKVSGVRATCVRARRHAQAILDRFPKTSSGWRILDAGCGGGRWPSNWPIAARMCWASISRRR